MVDRSDAQLGPTYVRIVTEIRRRISAGELRPDDRVPSTRQIVREWGVAMATATKVLTTLRQEGLVRAVPGVGTVVAHPEPAPAPRTLRRRQARAHHGELTRERVVRTAVGIADAEGLAALSMRRVATELDIATMSLYRYVSGKDELVVLMADAALGEDKLPEPPPPGWRARLELVARLQWTIYRRHPWLAQVMSFTRPPLIPNGMAHTDWTMRAVDGLGLDFETMIQVAVTLASYVRGTAVNLEPEAQAEQDTGLTTEQWLKSRESEMAVILASGALPMFSRILTQGGLDPDLDLHLDLDTLVEFGLQRVLDGIEVLIAQRTTDPRAGQPD